MGTLNHFDAQGNAVMVDVSEKAPTVRTATATGCIKVSDEVMAAIREGLVEAACTVKVTGKTGVEMEALTGVSAALLTIYDMCKAMDRSMELGGIHLVRKEGGKSGVYVHGAG